jgi:hypothetical protein
MVTSQAVINPASVHSSEPCGFAILCFMLGAPHIYGVMQSHQCHPQQRFQSQLPWLGFSLIALALVIVGIIGIYLSWA